MAPPNISSLFPEPDLGIFGPAIKEAQARSESENPLLQIAPAVMGVTQDPLDTTAHQYKQKALQGVVAGLLAGLGDQWQGSRNDDIRNAALGSGDDSSLAPNVLAPIANAKSIWGANQALQYARGSQILPLEQKFADQENHTKILEALIAHPESAALLRLSGGGGLPAASGGGTPASDYMELIRKYGSKEGADKAQAAGIEEQTKKDEGFDKFLDENYQKLSANQALAEKLHSDLTGAGNTGAGASTLQDLGLGIKARFGSHDAATTLGARTNLKQDAISILGSLRGGEDGKGAIPLRNQQEFQYFASAIPSEDLPRGANEQMINKLAQANQVNKAYLDFMSMAKQNKIPQVDADRAYTTLTQKQPLVHGDSINPVRTDGGALFGQHVFESLPEAKQKQLAQEAAARGISEFDFYKLLAGHDQ